MIENIIPSQEEQEQQEETHSPYMAYFKVLANDWKYVTGQLGNGYTTLVFWDIILGRMLIYGPGKGPDGPIDYNAEWEVIKKKDRISSEKMSRIRKQRFIDLCQEYEMKIVKSHNAMEEVKNKARGKENGNKSGAKPKSKSSSAPDPEDKDTSGSVQRIPPEDIQNTPAIIAKWQEYKPMSYGDAKEFIDEIAEERRFSEFISSFGLSGIILQDKILTSEYDEFDDILDCCHSGTFGSLISRDEEKLQLFIYCCLKENKNGEKIDILNLWKQYGGFRAENGKNLLWNYLDNNSKEMMNKLQSRYQYNHETRLWYPIIT